ncbi:aminopeptidase N [Mesorhizobium sp. J428]|uniref:aminopeptidase N n=1 Tax=Mesorhizobium sp. J428 TaxID=2898440 RepID=UPI0021509702|nr:aminopeptidase N [Mesorhizobium sp. J428]MCR5858939.1 aminopeptidase N [Mesorhizobium sp. J428]
MRTDTGQVFRLEDYRPSDWLIPRTSLTFRLDPDRTRVIAELTIERRDGVTASTPLVLDGDGIALLAISIDGVALEPGSYEATPQQLTIATPPRTRSFRLAIETETAPSANTALMGLYRSGGNYCTQCEAEGFRRITYFLDRPDVLSVYTVRIEARRAEAPLLLANGNPGAAGELADGWHFAEWFDPHPKPSYLFALVAGDLAEVADQFVTMSGRKVRLGIFVEHGKQGRAAYAMDALKRSMRWDEETFGREYDLDVFNIVAVSDFNMGAMENKGLNIFNDKYVLADRETATDADFANIEAIIAHEYFHNWTGNRITCRDWFQLCLKEGLTVFRDHEFSADERSRAVERIADVRTLRAHQFPEDQGPLAHPVRPRRYREINNFYTATVYEKGSEVVGMIRTILGAEDFRRGMDLYFERHDGEAATIEDFVKVFEDVSRRDLSQFSLWYHQAGTPNLMVSATHDANAATLTLEIEQSVPPTPGESRKKAMHIPLAFGLVGADGNDIACSSVSGATVEDGVIHLKKRRHVIRFEGLAERPAISLNRGFSAPVTIAFDQPLQERMLLARNDSDLFSRWQALTSLMSGALIDAAGAIRGGKAAKIAPELSQICLETVRSQALEPAYKALALTLPAEADIAREIGSNIDPDAILSARNLLAGVIATANADSFLSTYESLADTGGYSPDAASGGRRALRNVMLDYVTLATASPDIAARQYREAGNMTDRAAALSVLTMRHPGSAEAADALADFEARFGNDPLVMDKWFQIQAIAPGDGAVDRVRALMTHPGFSLGNPNRVRSLIGTYTTANQTGFHRIDGAGYELLAEIALSVDPKNPQLSARLATAFRSWRSLEEARRERARATLSRIKAAPALSADLRDIVERTLA